MDLNWKELGLVKMLIILTDAWYSCVRNIYHVGMLMILITQMSTWDPFLMVISGTFVYQMLSIQLTKL